MTLKSPSPKKSRSSVFDETAMKEAITGSGASLPNSFYAFQQQWYETHTYWTAGYYDLAVGDIMSPSEIEYHLEDARDWWGDFLPFTSVGFGFMAFDLRTSKTNPPVVFLDNEEARENDDPTPSFIFPVAANFDAFVNLLDVWTLPESVDNRPVIGKLPFSDAGINAPRFMSTIKGLILRSGITDERLEIPYLTRTLAGFPLLAAMTNWEQISTTHAAQLIPFMVGKDGWLALDYRKVDHEPPVVVIRRDVNHLPLNHAVPFAESVEAAFDRYLPGPISESIHRLDGLS